MTIQTITTDMVGFLKPIFGDLQWTFPEESLLQKEVDFSAKDIQGAYFTEPFSVQLPWGITYGGKNGDANGNALATAIPSQTQPAQVYPYQSILRNQIAFSLFDRAPDTKRAFMEAGGYAIKDLSMQMRRLLEISMLCGQSGIMEVESYDSSSKVVTFTEGSLRPGFLSIMKGAPVDFLNSTLASGIRSGKTVANTVKQVDVNARTLTLTGAAQDADPQAGDLLAIHGAATDADLTDAANWNEMIGLKKQVNSTGSLFGINKTTYNIFAGNSDTSGGPLEPQKLLQLATLAINKGFQGRMLVLVSPSRWMTLNAQIVNQQLFDQSYSSTKILEGTDAIEIRGTGVVLEVRAHPYQANGEALLLPEEYLKRIGSGYENLSGQPGDRDISFRIPFSNLEFVYPVPGYSAVEIQCRSDQQIYLQRPAFSVWASGLTV